MDTTPDRSDDPAAPAAEGWDARLDELAAADPAAAADLAERIAADLSTELDATGTPEPQQLTIEE